MTASVKTRRYHSQARRRQAEDTRRAVLRAARALFTTRGYAQTSVTEIARRAKVSVDTVYASVGRKPQLLLAVHDMILGSSDEPVPAEERDYVRRIRHAATAEEKIRLYADALADLLRHTAPLDLALRDAGAREPECRELRASISRRRRANMRLFAAELRDTGRLRPDLTVEQAADLVWSMNSPEYFQRLTELDTPPTVRQPRRRLLDPLTPHSRGLKKGVHWPDRPDLLLHFRTQPNRPRPPTPERSIPGDDSPLQASISCVRGCEGGSLRTNGWSGRSLEAHHLRYGGGPVSAVQSFG